MVGLGGGRRAARSVPVLLLLLALGACLAFLGLSSWVWRARGAELQLRLSGLEAKSRRAEVDRSAAELQRHQLQVHLHTQAEEHRKEVAELSDLHHQQRQAEADICRDDKEVLNRNITSSRRTVEKLQDQFQALQKEYSQLDQKLQELQKKLTYDVTQCSNQIRDQKELYEEQIKELNQKLAQTAKIPSDSKSPEEADQNKISMTPNEQTEQKTTEKLKETVKPSLKSQEQTKEQANPGEVQNKNELEGKTKSAKEVETNQIMEDTGVLEDANATRDDYDEKSRRTADNANQDRDEGFVDPLKSEEAEDYDGDEGNVAEFEADKEAELAGDTQGQGIKDLKKIEQDKNDQKLKQIL
ncbi:Golgi membrane protein 1 [Callorhinchus milii]|uniref:Golgi membrane protein 1 n=1 Tax=Callorhinchus milii TaxID=7868 RepID=V9KE69_CALMI|nr:Golgi membrane protein 1 [Callorhinchus milii]